MRLVDFQISAQAVPGASSADMKAANEALFPFYEAVRLWLKDRSVAAPFRKIVVTLRDAAAPYGGVSGRATAARICEVPEDVEGLLSKALAGSYQWLEDIVLAGLDHIETSLGWSSEELKAKVRMMAGSGPPWEHRFSKLGKVYRGVRCDLWFSAKPGRSVVEARFTSKDGGVERMAVAERPGPLFLEDDFPVAKAAVVGGDYILRSRDGGELARLNVPV